MNITTSEPNKKSKQSMSNSWNYCPYFDTLLGLPTSQG